MPAPLLAAKSLGGRECRQNRQGPDAPGPGNGGEQHQAHPAQTARLDEVRVRGAHGITVDPLGPDAPAAPPLDRVIDGHHDGPVRHKGVDQKLQEDPCASSRAPHSATEHAVIVHEVPLAAEPSDAQQTGHGPLTRGQDRADEQNLSVLPGAVDEQGCERDDDRDEAGGQAEHGGVSWPGHHRPSRHARFVTTSSPQENWPKSS
jgi:hypothetical protein